MRAVSRQIWVLVVAAAGLGGSPAEATDADHGSDLAKRWCAACHVVDADQKRASTDAPPVFCHDRAQGGFHTGKDRPLPA